MVTTRQGPTRTALTLTFGDKKGGLEGVSPQNGFVRAVFTRMVPTPQVGFCFLVLFFGAFSCHIHICIYILFVSLSSIMANVQFFFVNNVLGFAKKENNTENLLSLP